LAHLYVTQETGKKVNKLVNDMAPQQRLVKIEAHAILTLSGSQNACTRCLYGDCNRLDRGRWKCGSGKCRSDNVWKSVRI